MKCVIGLGSSLGDRRNNLERAALKLREISCQSSQFKVSPVFETPALVSPGAPAEWRKPYLNAAAEIIWENSPRDLLLKLKAIERDLGRTDAPRWAPRLIDLDLLLFGDLSTEEPDLLIPHREVANRPFVLSPLKHLDSRRLIPTLKQTTLMQSRLITNPLPLWMGILNLTPDSFSDGSRLNQIEDLSQRIDEFDQQFVQILDFGAESTRPGATVLSSSQEWTRLLPALEVAQTKFQDRLFRPLISVDTYHTETARRACEFGVDIINDVSGLFDPNLVDVLRENNCQYVLMHSLSVPADPNLNIKDDNLVLYLKEWAYQKLDFLVKSGVSLDRIIFDPGIGFGKTADQSFELLTRVGDLLNLPVRVLIGHSRKSFLKRITDRLPPERDPETLGISIALASKGVDIIRVHEPALHQRAYMAFQEVQS